MNTVLIEKSILVDIVNNVNAENFNSHRINEISSFVDPETNNNFVEVNKSKIIEWRNILACYGHDNESRILQNNNLY